MPLSSSLTLVKRGERGTEIKLVTDWRPRSSGRIGKVTNKGKKKEKKKGEKENL